MTRIANGSPQATHGIYDGVREGTKLCDVNMLFGFVTSSLFSDEKRVLHVPKLLSSVLNAGLRFGEKDSVSVMHGTF